MKAASQAVSDTWQSRLFKRISRRTLLPRYKGLQIDEGTSHIQRIIIARELVGRSKKIA